MFKREEEIRMMKWIKKGDGMYKHELYKIFTKKSIYIVLFFILLIMMYGYRGVFGEETLKGETFDTLFEEWGGPITDEKVEKARRLMQASDGGEQFPRADAYVHHLVAASGLNSAHLSERKQELRAEIKRSKNQTYKQKVMQKELHMLEKLNEPFGFYLIRAWQGMFDFLEPFMSVVFLATLVVLGVTPLFSEEYSNRTIHLLLATKNGKRKIITSKMMAMVTYITFVFILLHGVNFMMQVIHFGGISGWNTPMQNLTTWSLIHFSGAPFKWNILQFYLMTLGIQYIACLCIGILVMFLSILFKNTLITLLASTFMIGGPSFIGQFAEEGIVSQINAFNYAELLKASVLFEEFKVYNVFGTPILYPILLFILFVIVTVILGVSIYQIHPKTEGNI